MAEFYDITKWNEKPWYQTGGTRSKVIVENPSTHKDYYFKTSLKRELKDYKYEYWSEIIASEVGDLLGFDMLKYDIAFNRGEMGCISKSMVTEGRNKLTEGISYLTGYDNTYNPDDKNSKKQYTFQLICKSLKYFQLDRYIEKIIEIIILDSIIGNGDRHQENWGIVTEYSDVVKILEEIAQKRIPGNLAKSIFSILGITSKAKSDDAAKLAKEFHLKMPGRFSQIYDSGSCLGRELDDNRLKQMLTDNSMLEAYIRRGVSEIHWKGEKLNHFELIKEINKIYPEAVKKIVLRVKKKFDEQVIRKSIENIDLKLPQELEEHKLPNERKEFVIKLIALRVQTLIRFVE
ncbi:MAG TPA: hypothetical protein VFC67_11385 [Prolixibacteraceae bacterium]|nr:hypothetical protein [Prolixibacteraceae bacterium]